MVRVKGYVICTIFFFITGPIFSQITDSLYQIIPDSIKPKDKNNLTSNERQLLLHNSSKFLTFPYYHQLEVVAVSLEKNIKNTSAAEYIKNVQALADFYFLISKHDLAIVWYNKLIALTKDDGLKKNFLADLYYRVAEVYFYMFNGKIDSVVKYLHLYTDNVNESDLLVERNIADLYSSVYSQLQLFEKTILYNNKYLKTLSAAEKWDINYTLRIISTATTYFQWYRKTTNQIYADSAFKLVKEVMLEKKSSDSLWYGICYYIQANLYLVAGDYKKALTFFDSSLLTRYLVNDKYLKDPIDKNVGRAVCLIKLGNYAEGKKIIDGIDLGTKLFRHVLVNKTLYEYASSHNNWQDALQYYLKFTKYTDSLSSIDQKATVFDTEEKYVLAKNQANIAELENKRLINEKYQSRLAIVSGIIIFLITIILTVVYASQKKKQLKVIKEKQLLTDRFHEIETQLANERNVQQKTLEETVFEQRKKISNEMHDSISSGIAALMYYIADIKMAVHEAKAKKLVSNIEEETANLYGQTRRFMNNLTKIHPVVNYNVNSLLSSLSKQFTDEILMKVTIDTDEAIINKYFTKQQHYELYLVIKEAVANTLKHANASKIDIAIILQDNTFMFSIGDNGKDATQIASVDGRGLFNIRERISLLLGEVTFVTDGKGTIISGSFPMANLNLGQEMFS